MHKNNKSTTQEHLDEKIFSISMPSIFATQTRFQEFVHAPDLMQAHVLEPMLNLETYFVLPKDQQATKTTTSKSLNTLLFILHMHLNIIVFCFQNVHIFVLVFRHALVY
jgi:hypothetical protein